MLNKYERIILKIASDAIEENKPLYHFTRFHLALKILKENTLKNIADYIWFTTDNSYGRHSVCFVFDSNRLRKDLEVKHSPSRHSDKFYIVKDKEIHNIKKYLIGIKVNSTEKDFQNDSYSDVLGVNSLEEYKNLIRNKYSIDVQ